MKGLEQLRKQALEMLQDRKSLQLPDLFILAPGEEMPVNYNSHRPHLIIRSPKPGHCIGCKNFDIIDDDLKCKLTRDKVLLDHWCDKHDPKLICDNCTRWFDNVDYIVEVKEGTVDGGLCSRHDRVTVCLDTCHDFKQRR